MTEVNECPTKLIEDVPATNDGLACNGDIQPHQRVANTIAELIKSPNESGGKMIGLEGGWGSGKTSVVRMLTKALENDGDRSVFIFDAWAHEGDPLRRTFLESLIRHFQEERWVGEKKWDEEIERISRKKQTTTTTSNPEPTGLGKYFSASVLLIPLGAAVISSADKIAAIGSEIGMDMKMTYIIGLLISIAPFIVLTVNWIGVVLGSLFGSHEPSKADWYFLSSESTTTTNSSSITTTDPTSIEFEIYFRSLMADGLNDHKDRQLIIVLDNLDRINPEDALKIWSTLQTFLQDRDTRKEFWYKQLWIIVPYDPDGIEHLWSKRVEAEQEQGSQEDKDDEENEEIRPEGVETVASSFLDKSFQYRFEVPPPILSNWKSFLIGLINEALPKHKEDAYSVFRVLANSKEFRHASPTPRELKLYVNQIGILHRQWGHEFPLDHLAYYVLLRRSRRNVRSELLKKNFPDSNYIGFFDGDIRKSLAGLFFNVTGELGQQLLLTGPVFEALVDINPEELDQLEKNHGEGFWAVFDVSLVKQAADASPTQLCNIAETMLGSKIRSQATRSEYQVFLSTYQAELEKISSLSPIGFDLGKKIAAACRFADNSGSTAGVWRMLRESVNAIDLQEEGVQRVIEGLLPIIKCCASELGHTEVMGRSLVLSADAAKWLEFCAVCVKHDGNLILSEYIKPSAKADTIAAELVNRILQGQTNAAFVDIVGRCLSSPMDMNAVPLPNAIQGHLNASQNTNGEQAAHLLRLLSLLRKTGVATAEDVSRALVEQGHLAHCFHHAPSQKSVLFKGWCLATIAIFDPKLSKPTTVGNSDSGYSQIMGIFSTGDASVANVFLNACLDEGKLQIIHDMISHHGFEEFIIDVVRLIADSDHAVEFFDFKFVKQYSDNLYECLNDDDNTDRYDKLIEKLVSKTDLVEKLTKDSNGFDPHDSGLHLSILDFDSSDEYIRSIMAGLRGMSVEDWDKAIIKRVTEACDLAIEIRRRNRNFVLDHHFEDSLCNLAAKYLDSNKPPSEELLKEKGQLLALIKESNRALLQGRLLDAMRDRNGKAQEPFFQLFGSEMISYELISKSDGFVRKIFLPILIERNGRALEWVAQVAEAFPELLSASSDSAANTQFRERIQDELSEEESLESIQTIAGFWSIEKRPDQEVEEEAEAEESTVGDDQNGEETEA